MQRLERTTFNTGPTSTGTLPKTDFAQLATPTGDFACHSVTFAPQNNGSNSSQEGTANALPMTTSMPTTPVANNNSAFRTPKKGSATTSPKNTPDSKPKRKRKKPATDTVNNFQSAESSPKRASNGAESLSNDANWPGTSIVPYPSTPTTSPPDNVPHKFVQTDESSFAVAAVLAEADNKSSSYQGEISHLRKQLDTAAREIDELKDRDLCRRNTLNEFLIKDAKRERREVRERIVINNSRIGYYNVQRDSFGHFNDQWFDGSSFTDLERRKGDLEALKESLCQESAGLRKKRAPKEAKKNNELNNQSTFNDGQFVRPALPYMATTEFYDRREEILKLQREYVKKEEAELTTEKEKLDRERNLHIREIKRVQSEDASRYNSFPVLNKTYLPLALLGKGGFSEVWRAFDLAKCRQTACKIHHVNKEWKEGKKVNYVRHAMREKDIHKELDHPNIVRMFDVFTIDNDSFCTVLEYCDGNDLDFYLKQHRVMPEKETRLVIGQVVDALRYLNDRKVPIIHYDLKPANILLQTGAHRFEVKITDFGLSKTVENSEDNDSIELTSQGAGTYWYLPPETFREAGPLGAPKISSKVDVWSVGIICYQCIYGRKPFGHEQTQQRILKEGTILKATIVNFPAKPAVTQLTQDFIRKCLQYDPANRADVMELSRHEYARPFAKKVTI